MDFFLSVRSIRMSRLSLMLWWDHLVSAPETRPGVYEDVPLLKEEIDATLMVLERQKNLSRKLLEACEGSDQNLGIRLNPFIESHVKEIMTQSTQAKQISR